MDKRSRDKLHEMLGEVIDGGIYDLNQPGDKAALALAACAKLAGKKGMDYLAGGKTALEKVRVDPDNVGAATMRTLHAGIELLKRAESGSHAEKVAESSGRGWHDINKLRDTPAGQQATWLKPSGSSQKFDSVRQQYKDVAVGYADGEIERVDKTKSVNKGIAACYGVTAKTLNRWRDNYNASQPRDAARREVYELAEAGKFKEGPLSITADEGVCVLDFASSEGGFYQARFGKKSNRK
ncbi:MAG: hypothetical protein V3V15_07195 [Sphingorhabdus sp.]